MSKKRSVLLSSIGSKAYQTLASLVAPETPTGKKRVESLYDFQMICHLHSVTELSDKSFENHKVIRRVFFL